MKYYIELSDKRNRQLYRLMKAQGKDTYELTADIEAGSTCIFSPAKKFTAEEASALPSGIKLYAGGASDAVKDIFKRKNIVYINFLDNEIFAYKNAKLTAEGVLALLIHNTEKSVYESNILILGCGRCGKAISLLFKQLGLNFSVASYDEHEYNTCGLYCERYYFKDGYVNDIQNFDVIVNTIPFRIIDDNTLTKIHKDTVFFEIASVNCLDKDKVKFNYLITPGLPQVYSSQTAARLMLEIIE